jgi:uncharacterized membrane protein YhaH (DUF805 family)
MKKSCTQEEKTLPDVNNSLFSGKGRMGQKAFAVTTLALLPFAFVCDVSAREWGATEAGILLGAAALFIAVLYVFACTKRLRDIEQSPYLVLVSFIPVVGIIFWFYLAFSKSRF